MLDIEMPGIDGYEVLRRLKADPRTISLPVILVTGQGEIDEKMAGYERGASDYITKPFHGSFVLDIVHRLLDKRQ